MKHYHIHLAFVEKKPSYEYRNGKIGYRRLGMLSNDERNSNLPIERVVMYKTNGKFKVLSGLCWINNPNRLLNNI